MSGNKVFQVVKKHIDAMDYYALLAGGAPEDEFDLESREISISVNTESSILEIAEVIARVFEGNFGNKERPDVFLKTASCIKQDLQQK